MHTSYLRKIGGSIMLAVPPELLEHLQLQAGSAVKISLDGSRLIVESSSKPRYTLKELLAVSDYSVPQSQSEREWVDAPPIGNELL